MSKIEVSFMGGEKIDSLFNKKAASFIEVAKQNAFQINNRGKTVRLHSQKGTSVIEAAKKAAFQIHKRGRFSKIKALEAISQSNSTNGAPRKEISETRMGA